MVPAVAVVVVVVVIFGKEQRGKKECGWIDSTTLVVVVRVLVVVDCALWSSVVCTLVALVE